MEGWNSRPPNWDIQYDQQLNWRQFSTPVLKPTDEIETQRTKLKWWRPSTLTLTIAALISLTLWFLAVWLYSGSGGDQGNSNGDWSWLLLLLSSILLILAFVLPVCIEALGSDRLRYQKSE